MEWSVEQILALAPDAAAAKASTQVATPRNWETSGCNDRAVWGHCKGSGSQPYKVCIDLIGPGFKCSCPSRKIPCKHSLGLFLLKMRNPDIFSAGDQPEWVTAWLEGREKRSQAQSTKSQQTEPVKDVEQQTRRSEQRQEKIVQGITDLQRWLGDIIRNGLAEVGQHSLSFWESQAARLIDAQAPGLAGRVKKIGELIFTQQHWQEMVLEELGMLALLLESHGRLNSLPPDLQADIRTLIGWTVSKESLETQPGIVDRWAVIGQRSVQEDRLNVRRTWLHGLSTNRFGLILDFSQMGRSFDGGCMPGTVISAELAYYPGRHSFRALIRNPGTVESKVTDMCGYPSLEAGMIHCATVLAENPWTRLLPFPVMSVIPFQREGNWLLVDQEEKVIPISPAFGHDWRMRAISGGHPIPVFGEWDCQYLLPLSTVVAGRYIPFLS